MIKKILAALAALVLVATICVAAIPRLRNSVVTMFTRESATTQGTTEPTEPTEGTTDPTEPTEPTEGTTDPSEPAEGTTDPSEPAEGEEVVTAPFTFAQFLELATTDGMWHVPPKEAVIYDMTADKFRGEDEEQKKLFVPVTLRVTTYGAMTVLQAGFENKENHTGEVVAPKFKLCACKWHKESWNSDMGQFHWFVAENNQAMGSSCWTRMVGELQEVMMDFQAREIIRAAACYWFQGAAGEVEVVYGIRVCGDQKDPQPPVAEPSKPSKPSTDPSEPSTDPSEPSTDPSEPSKPAEPAAKEYKVSYCNVMQDGSAAPAVLNKYLPTGKTVKEGTKVEPQGLKATVHEVDSATRYVFVKWDRGETTVRGDVTFKAIWKKVVLTLKPTEPATKPTEPTEPSGNKPQHSEKPSAEQATNPVADKEAQDELNNLVQREESTGGSKNPQHSEKPSAEESQTPAKPELTLKQPKATSTATSTVGARTDGEQSQTSAKPKLTLKPTPTEPTEPATEPVTEAVDDSVVADEDTQSILNGLFGRG